jgi:hypothetical protein
LYHIFLFGFAGDFQKPGEHRDPPDALLQEREVPATDGDWTPAAQQHSHATRQAQPGREKGGVLSYFLSLESVILISGSKKLIFCELVRIDPDYPCVVSFWCSSYFCYRRRCLCYYVFGGTYKTIFIVEYILYKLFFGSNGLGGCYASVCVCVCLYIDGVVFITRRFPESAVFFYFQSFYAAVLNNTVNLMQTVSFFKKVNSPILLPVQKV